MGLRTRARVWSAATRILSIPYNAACFEVARGRTSKG
jgi:hypothetical protein